VPRRATPIERRPRGTPDYEAKFDRLSPGDRETLELVEESILSDQGRTHRRRTMPDGTIFDLTAYDEWDVLISFRIIATAEPQLIDFKFYDPR
jgi:hypothetical protein